jgi:hypothetical protein
MSKKKKKKSKMNFSLAIQLPKRKMLSLRGASLFMIAVLDVFPIGSIDLLFCGLL